MMLKVSVAELERDFGRYRDLALEQPVVVEEVGALGVVMVSATEFERLKGLEPRRSYYVSELPEELFQAIAASEPTVSSRALNHEVED